MYRQNILEFSCNTCGSNFQHLRELAVHGKRFHVHINKSAMKKKDWLYKCNTCDINFQHIIDLEIHANEVHSTCQESKETFKSTKSTFNETELNFNCSACESSYLSLKDLDTYTKFLMIDFNLFECQECMESFPTQYMLKVHFQAKARRHVVTMSNFDSNGHLDFKIDKCLHCNNYFSPFECQQCKESFTTREMLRRHVKEKSKTHHPYWKSFKCGNCNERAIKTQIQHGQIDLNKILGTVKGTHQTSKWTPLGSQITEN